MPSATAKGIESDTGKVDAGKAVKQLMNAMKKPKDLRLAGDVDRVEIIMPRGASFKNPNHGIKDGYLFDKVEGKTVEIEGLPLLFIKVVQL